jgi:transcription-repair coupling factor (superfamily II helicase)
VAATAGSLPDNSLAPLLSLWPAAPEFRGLLDDLERGPSSQLAYGLGGSQRTFLVAGLLHQLGWPCLYVVQTPQHGERIAADLEAFLPGVKTMMFPSLEVLPYDVLAQGPDLPAARLAALRALSAPTARSGEGDCPPAAPAVVIAPLLALTRKLPPAAELAARALSLARGSRYDLGRLAEKLVLAGYERMPTVEAPGSFAVRGGVLDLYPFTASEPVRAEFFGDELESLRAFDPTSQRSTVEVCRVEVSPASEFLPGPERRASAAAAVRADLLRQVGQLERAERFSEAGRLRERVAAHLERLEQGDVQGLDTYLAYCYPDAVTLLEYLPERCLVVWDEPARLKEVADGQESMNIERYRALFEGGGALPLQAEATWRYEDLLGRSRGLRQLSFSLVLRRAGLGQTDGQVALTARPVGSFHGQWGLLTSTVQRLRAEGRIVAMLVGNPGRAARIVDAFSAEGFPISQPGPGTALEPATYVLPRTLEDGFVVPALNLAVLTENEISGRPVRKPRPRQFKAGRKISSYLDLKVGDYVVHINHGIGRYLGVVPMEIEGVRRDYLSLKYSAEDRLFVPTDQVELIQRYVGGEGSEPKLNRLGGAEWARTKNRVRESVREMAQELIELYAMREVAKGHAFGLDTTWQREFEEAFPYEETADQLRSVAEIKADMERERPMDRLLCGDVGYGKTEVAVRAAFKAVMDGRQVALLVPTTILAQQHYNTFRERFGEYPVTVELLSRFRSPAQLKRTLAGLRSGRVDIVIGTHRMLSQDVAFSSLGLLIVDEEHRFGVGQKERIKQLRRTVDVLTLSATPIPRTLHMAMAGVRDMSLIETPPEDRFPVQTFVVEYSDELVRDAIMREIARGGQVFYVHNRVMSIDRAAQRLTRLVPEARVTVGHGQMAEDQLEQVMISFLEREYDVLLCTTIIESGLDMANVNTLIVDDADHLGLAQLYQLRGRVGRSSRLAYAYFTYKRDKALTEVAEKRLDAIRQFTELGSGFKIAMRDLEIRGMGNLLGPEQHGFMAAVGLDLYIQLLQEAVAELRGHAPAEQEAQAAVELPVDALLPDDYVPDPGHKVDIYRRLAAMRAPAGVAEMREELVDRFGKPPDEVENLLAVTRLRILASRCGMISVSLGRDGVYCRFGEAKRLSGEKFMAWVAKHKDRVSLKVRKEVALRIRVPRAPVVVGKVEPGRGDGAATLRRVLAAVEDLHREAVR